MLWGSLALVTLSMMLVRVGWGRRSALSWSGWAGAIAALLLSAKAEGAWGMALAILTAMTVPLAALLHAGGTSPARRLRPPREPVSAPAAARWADLGRRLAVFVVTVPLAFAATAWLAFGFQAVARADGMADANATALTFALQPLLWALVLSWQMILAGPVRMTLPVGVTAAAGTALWGLA